MQLSYDFLGSGKVKTRYEEAHISSCMEEEESNAQITKYLLQQGWTFLVTVREKLVMAAAGGGAERRT